MKIYLDDKRDPPDNSWTLFRNIGDMARAMYIESPTLNIADIEVFSLDHDLGDFIKLADGKILELDGVQAINSIYEWFNYKGVPVPKILIHSANPIGRQNMIHRIEYWQQKLKHDLKT
jgi:hypothetical protein